VTSKKLDSLAILTAMNEAQQHQFMAATTLVIGTIMKKVGLKTLSITPEDVDALQRGETLRIDANPNGGFTYVFNEPVEGDAAPVRNVKPKRKNTAETHHRKTHKE
jgi:hypothetical protein